MPLPFLSFFLALLGDLIPDPSIVSQAISLSFLLAFC